MVSDASPGATDPKMNESFVHMARASFYRAFTQDGYFKRPHPTIIDGDMWLDSGWFWCCGTSDMRLARQKQCKNNAPQPWQLPSSYDLHGAPPPAPPQTTISQHAAQQVYLVKTREYDCFYYLLAI